MGTSSSTPGAACRASSSARRPLLPTAPITVRSAPRITCAWIAALLDAFDDVLDLFLGRVSAHIDDHSENASCSFPLRFAIFAFVAQPLLAVLLAFFASRFTGKKL